ncbi:MAG: ATP-dependent DNA helicase [Ignavibacteria bacterium]|nr:ATP-dependent DNA helicase [Ignavibacteria bacterium]
MKLKESENIEFKKSTSELKESLISISAILNKHRKGILYFGMKSDSSPVKNTISEKTLRDISQAISNKIEPRIYPIIEMVKIKSIDVIRVSFEGHQVPYSANGRYYIRVADEDKQMSSGELQNYILKNKDHRWDKTVNLRAKINDIDVQKVKIFCNIAGIKFTNSRDIMESLNLIQNLQLTNAAVLLFGKNPEKFYSNTFLSCAVFATDKTTTILDQKKFEGDIFYLLEEAEKYILQNIHIGMKVKGLYRDDVPEIDKEALRESLINAFLHRDYYNPDFIYINIFQDRLEIRNPGNIFGGLTLDDIIKRHLSKRRNELLADIFNRAHLGERKGRGVSLILEKEPETKFESISDIFITTFRRKKNLLPQLGGVNGGVSGGIKLLYEVIQRNPGLRIPEISKQIKIPERTIEKWIGKLKKKDLIEFKGSTKTGGYFIKKIGSTNTN